VHVLGFIYGRVTWASHNIQFKIKPRIAISSVYNSNHNLVYYNIVESKATWLYLLLIAVFSTSSLLLNKNNNYATVRYCVQCLCVCLSIWAVLTKNSMFSSIHLVLWIKYDWYKLIDVFSLRRNQISIKDG